MSGLDAADEKKTWSVCPVCLERVPASRVWADGALYLCKTCPVHGDFKTVVRRGDTGTWGVPPPSSVLGEGCPLSCGDCPHDDYG